YQTIHRHPNRPAPAFSISGVYGLEKEHGRQRGSDHEWPEDWPSVWKRKRQKQVERKWNVAYAT
ncbi:MAG: hypothetical protein ABI885_16575, partial [Gammaproteobacteria bacterium]